jgi:hypothetical protein
MIEITDSISKILSRDSQNGYSVLTYVDSDSKFTDISLKVFIEEIISKFPVLKQYIVEKNADVFLEDDIEFNIENHYKVIDDTYDNFDSYTDMILNSEFETKSKWLLHYITDNKSKKYRLYFKIDHSYADGYKIIEMLMSPLKITNTSNTFKHRTTNIWDSLYYMLICTFLLFYNFCSILLESVCLTPKVSEVEKTDHLKCKPLKLSEIKELTLKHNITVNDFLYSLLVKTDYLYTKVKRDIVTSSPVNISGSKHFNNIAPIINKITNTLDNKELFKNVHNRFNSYKYSLYIPIFSFILNFIVKIIPLNITSYLYNSLIQRSDYVYSNIIGPSHEMIEDIHFLTLAKDKEIVFNIISSNDNINIICSFKEGVIGDKKRFEECIYKAYESLSTPNEDS